MTHPIYHAKSSVKQFGGEVHDYIPVHHWLDATKEHYAGFRHRALRHHVEGVAEAVKLFGQHLNLFNGKSVEVATVCEFHIMEDCGGKMPTLQDWFDNVESKLWMPGGDPMTLSLEAFVKRWGGVAADYQAIVDWFEWAPVTYSDLTLKGYRYHSQGAFEAERAFGYSIVNSSGRVVPVRYIAEQHIKLYCGGRIPTVGDWLNCINPCIWMSRGYKTSQFEHAVDFHHLMAGLDRQPVDFDRLELTDEQIPDDFFKGIHWLRRPYAKISEADFLRINQMTIGRGDILKYHNVKMTFGNADGGWALMPLDDEHQDIVFY